MICMLWCSSVFFKTLVSILTIFCVCHNKQEACHKVFTCLFRLRGIHHDVQTTDTFSGAGEDYPTCDSSFCQTPPCHIEPLFFSWSSLIRVCIVIVFVVSTSPFLEFFGNFLFVFFFLI